MTAFQYWYKLTYVLKYYINLHEKLSDEVIFGGGRPLPYDSTTYYLKYLSVGINFINTWLKSLAYNVAWVFFAYVNKMKELPKEKPQQSLHKLLKM